MKSFYIMVLMTFLGSEAMALPAKYVVVPNRSDSSITLLSTPDGKVLQTVGADDVGQFFEPLYAYGLHKINSVVVGDRKNSQLLVFDENDFRLLGAIPTSNGIFHLWASPDQREIYTVADGDRVVDVVGIRRFGDQLASHRRSIPVGDLFATGKPHDVVADQKFVFITMQGVEDPQGKGDYLLKYDRKSLRLLGKMRLSFDSHLGLPQDSPYLLVPEQTAGLLNFIDKETFEVQSQVVGMPGAHGIFSNHDASRVFLSNFLSKGALAVYEVRQTTGKNQFSSQLIKSHALEDTKAHNIAVDFGNQVMFVTHSGPGTNGDINNKVSLFSVAGDSKFLKTIEVGQNPLGVVVIDQKK